MKVNKITAFICLIITIISGCLLMIYKNNEMLQSILSGIFTGFIVSLVVAVIGYFHERAKIIEAIDENIRSSFLNITVISKIAGNVLPTIHTSNDIQDLPFKNIVGLASLNPEFIIKMNLGLYSPVFTTSKQALVCKRLKEFLQTTYNIKNFSSRIESCVLNYNLQKLRIRNNELRGIIVTTYELQNLDNIKNDILVLTAKLHEYTTCQAIEAGKIAKDFYGYKKKHLYWDDIEADLLREAENIVRGR